MMRAVWPWSGIETVSCTTSFRHLTAPHFIYAFHSYGAMLVVTSYSPFICGTAHGYQQKNNVKGSVTRLDSLVGISLQEWAGNSDTPLWCTGTASKYAVEIFAKGRSKQI